MDQNRNQPQGRSHQAGGDARRQQESKQPWDGYRFSAATIGEGVRLFLKQLWSTYFFYSLYAHAGADQLSGAGTTAEPTDELDRWALSRTGGRADAPRGAPAPDRRGRRPLVHRGLV